MHVAPPCLLSPAGGRILSEVIRKLRKRKATNATETARRKAFGRQWGGYYHAERLAGRWGRR